MGFWWFMLTMELLVPITMIAFGSHFLKHPPKKINGLYGYRTSRSMKNMDTWNFAHHYCGKLWRILGWLLLAVSAIMMLLTLGQDKDAVGAVGGVLSMVQILILVGSIFPTEQALKKTFDEYGRRRINI